MATSGWYLIGPVIAGGLVGFLGTVFWCMGRQPAGLHETNTDGLTIFGELDDYGLLWPAAITDGPETAGEIRRLLADAGIRTTTAIRRDGRVSVLVFAEEAEEARRLVASF